MTFSHLSKNSSKTSSVIAWSLWAVVTFFYAFQYVLRVSPSVLMSNIMQKFGIDAVDFGSFSGIYYLGYALMHIPIGLMLDRLPVKWVISGSIFVSVVGILPLTLSDSWGLSVLGRFMVGAGSSGAILSVFKITRLYFNEQWFSRLLGLSVTIGVLGGLYGSTPVDKLNQQFGWENVLLIFFAVGAFISLAILIFAPRHNVQADDINHDNIWQELKTVLSNRRVLLTAFFAALMVGPLEGFADVWAVSFLETVYGFDRVVATSLPPLIYFGMCVGSPLLAAMAEKFKAYYEVTILCAIGMAIIFVIFILTQPSATMIGIIFFLIGLMSAYQVLAIYMNSKNTDERYSGLVTALTNMIIMGFGSFFHYVISRVMNIFWDGKIVDNLAIYEPTAYINGIMVIPVTLMIAFVGFIVLRQPRTIS